MRVLVTGGSGFIGTHMVEALRARGDEPVVVDLKAYPDPAVACLTGDLRDPGVVAAALQPGTEGVVHLASATSVLRSMLEPHEVFGHNVVATEHLLERSRVLGVEKFVFASTNAVCGDVASGRIDESTPIRPLTPYGATKAAAEMLLSAYAGSYGLATVALRFTNVYGRGMQVKDSIVARLMRATLRDEEVQVYGDGEQARDYLYVTDAVAALLLGLSLPAADVLTIGAERSLSVNNLIQLTSKVVGKQIQHRHVEVKKGEMPAVVVDTTRARAAGFAMRYGLDEGLAETWADFREIGTG